MNLSYLAGDLRSSSYPIFSFRDLTLLYPKENSSTLALQLHLWKKQGKIAALKRGLYEMRFPSREIIPDLHVANRLYEPSYVSLETALSYYQIIPETAMQVTSVTPKATRVFANDHGHFFYFSMDARAFTGYSLTEVQGYPVRMALPEKALLDWLYAKAVHCEKLHVEDERLDAHPPCGLKRSALKGCLPLYGRFRPQLERWLDVILQRPS